jgi:shikimate dehydrogenase
MPTKYGLIGKSISHSFSQNFFTDFFLKSNVDGVYSNFDLDNESELDYFLQHTDCHFCNVTMPYKIIIQKYLHHIDAKAQSIHAVNCIKKIGGKWYGINTDIIGFEQSFSPNLQAHHTHAMVIGNGGASQAIQFVLRKLGIAFVVVSRTPIIGSISYSDVDAAIMDKYKIIINTTPLGMHPAVDSLPPLPYQLLSNKHYLFDLVYNPTETKFLWHGNQCGATCVNGWQMLQLQAMAAWEWWQKE